MHTHETFVLQSDLSLTDARDAPDALPDERPQDAWPDARTSMRNVQAGLGDFPHAKAFGAAHHCRITVRRPSTAQATTAGMLAHHQP
jgi:hypothetical protein